MGRGSGAVRIAPLPGTTPDLIDYRSPSYDKLEADALRKMGRPDLAPLLRSVRVNGERSNADMQSPAGAMTVYQIMPATRALFLQKYGIDAYSSPSAAAQVAALHLAESLRRNKGDRVMAFAEYNAGPDRARQWTTIPETREYVRRTLAGLG